MVRYILPANAMIGPYRIEKALGRGGMGEVYLARHVKLNIFRAIKILLPSIAEKDHIYAERFMNEARLAIDMRHQNIINVMDANYDERYGVYYIVMEYVDGASIRKIIKARGRFDEQTALKIVLKVAEALLAAEKMKIVHRDIKPDNIMMTSDGEVKLADLGIAKSGSENVELTNPQTMLGTIAYISPEQATDAQSVDSRADIYSLGVTLYEMLAAEKPYTGTQVEILQQVFNAPVPNIQAKVPAVSVLTAKLLKKMMAKDPADRPRNFETLCRLLSKLIVDKDPESQEYLQQVQEMYDQQKKLREEKKRILEERRRLSEEQSLIEAAKKKISTHDRKFSEERVRLSEEQSMIEEEKKKISDHQKLFSAERRRIEEERKQIEDERRRMVEQQKKISEKEQKISAEGLRLAEERRRKRMEKIKIVLNRVYCRMSGDAAKKVYKVSAVFCLVLSMVFLGFYFYQTGTITKSTVDEVIEWIRDTLTPEEMRKKPSDHSVFVHEKGVVTLVPLANQRTLDWLAQNNEIKIRGKKIGTVVSRLPGKISLPAGDYNVSVDIPGCKTFNTRFSLDSEGETRIRIPVIPSNGKVSISCNVRKFEILHRGRWIAAKSVEIPAFVPYDLIVRAEGHRGSVCKNIVLSPGKSEDISVILERMNTDLNSCRSGNMAEAITAFNEKSNKGYTRALKIFKQEREKGNPVAAYYLGMMYERGLGMMFGWSNPKEAAKCYKFAVQHDVPEALHRMGTNYERDGAFEEAFKSFMSGVELGHLPCFRKVGEYYFNGTGSTGKNLTLASHYLLLPANNADAEAQLMLGKIYESDELTLHDLQQAKHWYEEAAKNGSENAKIFLEQVQRTMEIL
ncbi:MAG: protein kinase [Lentisphaeria bacterium]|nr:protein kinase [Lentisphaeria bacterium]